MFTASTVTIMTDDSINTSSSIITNMMKNSLTLAIQLSIIAPCSNVINNFMGLTIGNTSKSAKNSIQSMYESYFKRFFHYFSLFIKGKAVVSRIGFCINILNNLSE
jgi:hypothetical protein